MGGRRNTHSLLHFMYLHTLQDVKIDIFFFEIGLLESEVLRRNQKTVCYFRYSPMTKEVTNYTQQSYTRQSYTLKSRGTYRSQQSI